MIQNSNNFGYDAVSGLWKPIAVDASGRLTINPAGPILLTQPVTVQGTVTVNQPVQVRGENNNRIFAYESPVNIIYSNTTLATGNNQLTVYTVPANKLLILMGMLWQYTGTITNVALYPRLDIAGGGYIIGYTKPPVSSQP